MLSISGSVDRQKMGTISLEAFSLSLYSNAGVGHVDKNVLLIVQDSMHEIHSVVLVVFEIQ